MKLLCMFGGDCGNSASGLQLMLLSIVPSLRVELLNPDFAARGAGANASTRMIEHFATLLNPISNAALALVLLSLFFYPESDGAPGASYTPFLEQVTRLAVIVYGVILIICMLRFFMIPYLNSELKDAALTNGQTPIPVSALVKDFIKTLVSQACMFAAPYVVFKSSPRESEGETVSAIS